MSPSRRRRRASSAWEGRAPITVATLPGRGLYARHLTHPEGVDGVHRVTVGPPGTVRDAGSFDSDWLTAHLGDVDVVHVNGLPPSITAAEVTAAVDVVQASGTPLVATGYHLSDPTGTDDEAYAARLDALIPRADAVVTLTDSAADEIRRRWAVDPLVLPHPHAVDFVRMRRERPLHRRGELAVGMLLAALHLPVDPVALVESLTRAVRGVGSARLAVHLHETVLDTGSARYDLASVREIDRLVRAAGGIVRLHRPFTETQLWDHLFSLDVSVVPGLHGSHSIWPEACADLGTQALLPANTHASAQRPCLTYEGDTTEDLTDSFAKALWTAREQGCLWRADPQERWSERIGVAEGLRTLYERLLGGSECGFRRSL